MQNLFSVYKLITTLILMALSLSFNTALALDNLKVFVLVGKNQATKSWAEDRCNIFHRALNLSAVPVSVFCDMSSNVDMISQQINTARLSNEAIQYFIDYREYDKGKAKVRVINWNPELDSDFTQATWNLEKTEALYSALPKLLRNFVTYHKNKIAIKSHFVKEAIFSSHSVQWSNSVGFVDSLTLEPLSNEAAIHYFKNESEKNKLYLRTAIEITLALGANTAHYFTDQLNNHLDQLSYYLMCQSNNVITLESILCTATITEIWKHAVEFHQLVNVGHDIFVSPSGMIISETLNVLMIFLRKPGQAKSKHLMSSAVNSIWELDQQFKNNIVEANKKPNIEADMTWTNMEVLTFNENLAKFNSTSHDSLLRSNVIQTDDLPSNQKDTSLEATKGIVYDRKFDSVYKKIIKSDNKNDLHMLANLMWKKVNNSEVKEVSKRQFEGFNFVIGQPAEAGISEIKDNRDANSQLVATINVVDGGAEIIIFRNGFKVRTYFDLFTSFAMMRSYTIEQVTNSKNTTSLPSILQQNQSYYGTGQTNLMGLEVAQGNWTFGGLLKTASNSALDPHHQNDGAAKASAEGATTNFESEVFVKINLTKDLIIKLNLGKSQRLVKTNTSHSLSEETTHFGASFVKLF